MIRKSILTIAAILGMTALSCTSYAEPRTEFYGQRATLFEILGTGPEDIVFFGNSLTNGCEWHELFNNPHIKNRGINGDTVDGLNERLTSVTDGKPAKIFLLTGVNDVSHDLSADSIAESLLNLVARIQKLTPDTKIYVESLLPINNSFGRYRLLKDKEQVIRDINGILKEKVPATGATFIDISPIFEDEYGNLRKDLTNDGLHLLGPAYLLWRDALEPYVNE